MDPGQLAVLLYPLRYGRSSFFTRIQSLATEYRPWELFVALIILPFHNLVHTLLENASVEFASGHTAFGDAPRGTML